MIHRKDHKYYYMLHPIRAMMQDHSIAFQKAETATIFMGLP